MTMWRARTIAAARRTPCAAGEPSRLAFARTWLALVFALSTAALSGCASTGADAPKDGSGAIRIECVIYGASAQGSRPDQRFELIDKSRSSAADLYSKTRKLEDASTKVTTDEILKETLAFFESKGFFEKAESGPAPSGSAGLLRAIEVETPDRFVHLTIQKGFTQPEMTRFMECQKAFFDIYNNTYQLQAVDRAPDWESQNQGKSKKKPNG
jgi:hypothetical protein